METMSTEVNCYSFTDDSYEVIHGAELTQTADKLERVKAGHIEQLTSIGMIVN